MQYQRMIDIIISLSMVVLSILTALLGWHVYAVTFLWFAVFFIIGSDISSAWLTNAKKDNNKKVSENTNKEAQNNSAKVKEEDIDFSAILEQLKKDQITIIKRVPEKLFEKSVVEKPNTKYIDGIVEVIKSAVGKKGVSLKYLRYSATTKMLTLYFLGEQTTDKNGNVVYFDIQKLSKITSNIQAALGTKKVLFAPFVGEADTVSFTIPLENENVLRLGNYYSEFKEGSLDIVLGEDLNGEVVMRNLSKMVSLLLVGSTGSGKSSLLRNIVIQLVANNDKHNLLLYLSDNKGVELAPLKDLMQTEVFTTSYDETIEMVKELVDIMNTRNQKMLEVGVANIAAYNKKVSKQEKLPYILLILEEWMTLVTMDEKDALQTPLVQLLSKSRSAGIHTMVVTQIANTTILPTKLRANLITKMVLRIANAAENKVVGTTDADKLSGNGDCILVSNGNEIRFQSPYVPTEEMASVVKYIREKYNDG